MKLRRIHKSMFNFTYGREYSAVRKGLDGGVLVTNDVGREVLLSKHRVRENFEVVDVMVSVPKSMLDRAKEIANEIN